MKLYYNSQINAHTEIKDRMDSLSLSFNFEERMDDEAMLEDGKKDYLGEMEITKYLDDIAGELHKWHYCNC